MNLKEKSKHLERLSWLNSHLSHKFMVDNNILPGDMTHEDIKRMDEWVNQEGKEYYKSLKYFFEDDDMHKPVKLLERR